MQYLVFWYWIESKPYLHTVLVLVESVDKRRKPDTTPCLLSSSVLFQVQYCICYFVCKTNMKLLWKGQIYVAVSDAKAIKNCPFPN